MGKEKFIVVNDVPYSICNENKHFVVPSSRRNLVMHHAHTLLWAFLHISSHFYRPSMYTDIQKYCASCPTCQKTCTAHKSDQAFLQPLPVISTPFNRIAMDTVANSTQTLRFQEAFPLCTITAPVVVRTLVQLFSRVGIPDKILADQGTNFTSSVMQFLYRQLCITAIKTTPYHPQTDGLVKRFNQTLKRMLQKFVDDTGKDWDHWLPFLLFAYCKVPQTSTGFSPFELLYGWEVQGQEAQFNTPSDKGVVQFVLEMRN